MATKLEHIKNYFVITDTVTGLVEHEYPSDIIYFRADGNQIAFSLKFNHIPIGVYTWTDLVDSNELPYSDKPTLISWLRLNTGTPSIVGSTGGSLVDLATNDLGRDAWGRPKVILDYTLFSALWTFNVPNRMWTQFNDIGAGYVEQGVIDNILVKSEHGHLVVKGDENTNAVLSSKRHPRYQPNKGLLYSTAIIVPDVNVVATRRWGIFNEDNGMFFETVGSGTDYVFNIVRRTTSAGVLSEQRIDITSYLPIGFDIEKGHVYDIQMQWRGVGDICIFIDLIRVYKFSLIGTLTEMSISNPALPISFEVVDALSGFSELRAGCVDVTSEGGHKSNKLYTSVDTNTTLLATTSSGVGILAVKIPKTITYNGDVVRYTRDLVLTELTTFCKDEAFRSVFAGRAVNLPNLDGLTWLTNSDSYYNYITNGDGTLDTAFQLDKGNMENIYATRNERDISSSHNNPDPEHANFYLTTGDIIVVELKSDSNSTGGATLEFAEEV